jgi:murein L,D-transpeptidase YcbB/YkuD
MTVASFAPMRRPGFLRSFLIPIIAATGLLACERPDPGAGTLSRGDERHALEVLREAPAHGFAADTFGLDRIEAGLKSDDPAARRQLQRAVITYAKAQHGLLIPRSAWPKDWGLKPAPYDAAAELKTALAQGKFDEWLDSQAPQSPAYQALQKSYAAYLKMVADGGWAAVASASDVAGLRARLAAEDGAVSPEGGLDAGLAEAVKRFQLAHGLPPSGRVDKETLKELNVPAAVRAVQIRANLERLRWLPRETPATRIDVNTAAQTVVYYVDDKPALAMRAAAGKLGDESPMLSSAIDSIVLNPPWNVPEGIAAEELYPKGADYLARNNFITVDGGRLVQQPGPDSALGLVKFDFDNPYAVYLHDTPSKAAFNRSSRAVSHGCVRLERALDLARMLLANQAEGARMDEILASRETTTVKLSQKIPVTLIYLTAFAQDGRVAFRPDIYGWDSRLVELLDHPPAQTAESKGKVRKKSA